jgi:hypothetical protein
MDKTLHDLLHNLIDLVPAHPRDLLQMHQLVDDAAEPEASDDDVSRETPGSDPVDAKGKTPATPAFRAAGA